MIVNGKRALAHTEKVEWVKPIEGADNIELIGVLGWTCIAKIDEFKEGDICAYIEIDSKVPEKEWSEFLRPKHFKVKTMKLGKFKVISQGLALPIDVFDVEIPNEVGVDITDLLGITYSVKEDNKRKGNGPDKYQRMVQRKPHIFKQPWARWFMRREWGDFQLILNIFIKQTKNVAKICPGSLKIKLLLLELKSVTVLQQHIFLKEKVRKNMNFMYVHVMFVC